MMPLPLHASFHQAMESCYRPKEDGDRLAVALSGGADSLCATLLAHSWAQQQRVELHTLTVNHGLRPEAEKEAHQVALWMRQQNIPHTILTLHISPDQPMTQKEARTLRYQALSQWCDQQGIQTLILGHQADDQLETFLMRMDHASGPYGLACMAPRSQLYGLTLLRPLLGIRHAHLVKALEALPHPWIEDPSNQNPRYLRTRYRHMVQTLEDQGLHLDHVLKSIQKISDHMAAWSDEAENLLQRALVSSQEGWKIHADLWRSAPLMVQKRGLEILLQRINPRPYLPKHHETKIQKLLQIMQDPKMRKGYTLGGCLFTLKAQEIEVRLEHPRKVLSHAHTGHENAAEALATEQEAWDHSRNGNPDSQDV